MTSNNETGIDRAVIPGLAVGIAFIFMFYFLFNSTSVMFPEKSSHQGTISIEGLEKQHHVGDELDIRINIQGVVSSCSYPYAVITNTDASEVLWDSGTRLVLCDPDGGTRPVNVVWFLGKSYIENGETSFQDLVGKIIPAKAGNYVLTVTYDELESSIPFTIYP